MGIIQALGPKIIPVNPPVIEAVSTDVAMYVRYVGSSASATVEVAAGGDMTFKHGASGAEAVDSGIGSSGVIDLSTPAASVDTMGELVDIINATSNWRAILWAARRSHLTDNSLITLSAVQAKGTSVGLLYDTTSVHLTSTYTIGTKVSFNQLLGMTDEGYRFGITRIEGSMATVTVPIAVKVFAVNDRAKTERCIYISPLLTISTAFEFNDIDFGTEALVGRVGEALVVEASGATGLTLTTNNLRILQVQGYAEQVSAGNFPGYLKSDI